MIYRTLPPNTATEESAHSPQQEVKTHQQFEFGGSPLVRQDTATSRTQLDIGLVMQAFQVFLLLFIFIVLIIKKC